jgi:hypothetical protein
LPPPGRDFGGREWCAALEAIERRTHQGRGKKSRRGRRRQRRDVLMRCVEMATREVAHFRERGMETGRSSPGKYVVQTHLIALE